MNSKYVDVSDVPRIDDHLHIGLGGSKTLEDRNRVIQRTVVDEDVLVTIAIVAGHDLAHLPVQFFDVVLLVVARRYDTDRLQCHLLERSFFAVYRSEATAGFGCVERSLTVLPLREKENFLWARYV